MRRLLPCTLTLLAIPMMFACGTARQTPKDCLRSIFDGASLEGWRAIPPESRDDWTVEDGAIVGRGSRKRLSYLVWHRELTDFELEFSVRMITKGNSGVEVRARIDESGKRPLEGYHADFGHIGIGPQILGAWDFHFATRAEPPCPRGTRLIIAADGELEFATIDGALTLAGVREGWNDVRVVARGQHLSFEINGRLASEFTDHFDGAFFTGLLGLQLHDKGMVVAFRDLRVREL